MQFCYFSDLHYPVSTQVKHQFSAVFLIFDNIDWKGYRRQVLAWNSPRGLFHQDLAAEGVPGQTDRTHNLENFPKYPS